MKATLTPRLLRRTLPLLAAGCLLLGATGCSTPGANHAYLAAKTDSTPIIDRLPGTADVDVPTFIPSGDELCGIAYDPFTDHLFLRVSPGDFVIVVDRPARKIKRTFYAEGLPLGRGDLAIRSGDRHLFFAHPTLPALVETNLEGRRVRIITLEGLRGAPAGVAYDQKHDRFLILQGGDRNHVGIYDLSGKRRATVALDRDVRLTSLAYDSVAGEFYAPLLDEPAVGIFDAKGRYLRSLTTTDQNVRDFVDVGERSLIRMF